VRSPVRSDLLQRGLQGASRRRLVLDEGGLGSSFGRDLAPREAWIDMKSESDRSEGREVLTLSEWELANLHLPAVTTVTLYPGDAPVEFLRQRVASMLERNPWLTARLVKKMTQDGVVAMAYDRNRSPRVDEHFSVYEPGQVGLSLDMRYEDLVRSMLPIQCARSKPATDADEPLFKVMVVPLEAGGDDAGPAPMRSRLDLPGFALVVSMNHTVGDGHTYYSLYGMLDAETEVRALDPVRVTGFEEAKTRLSEPTCSPGCRGAADRTSACTRSIPPGSNGRRRSGRRRPRFPSSPRTTCSRRGSFAR